MILYLIFSRWIFEKFDGIRGIWHFQLRTFYSRWGTPLLIAQFVTDTLPSNMWLDGEVSTNWNQYSCVAFYVVRYGLEEVRGLVITRWRLAWYFLLSNMLESQLNCSRVRNTPHLGILFGIWRLIALIRTCEINLIPRDILLCSLIYRKVVYIIRLFTLTSMNCRSPLCTHC